MGKNLPIGAAATTSAESMMGNVISDLHQALGIYDPTLVPVPVLFGIKTGIDEGLLAKSANVVNCLNHSDDKVYYAKTGCAVFESYIGQVLPGSQAVDVWRFHCSEGEIHCGTSAIRNLPLQPSWWEVVENWE